MMDIKILIDIIECCYMVMILISATLLYFNNITITNPDEELQRYYERHEGLFKIILSIFWPALWILVLSTHIKEHKKDSR